MSPSLRTQHLGRFVPAFYGLSAPDRARLATRFANARQGRATRERATARAGTGSRAGWRTVVPVTFRTRRLHQTEPYRRRCRTAIVLHGRKLVPQPGLHPVKSAALAVAICHRSAARHSASQVGQRLSLCRCERAGDSPERHPGPHSRAGDTTGVDRRLDLSRAAGPRAGDRPRREGTQAVSLSPGLAGDARRDEVRPHAGVRARVAAPASPHESRSGAAGTPA